ncbi:PQQ-binding-like beta-propeller repeat protein [Chitinophaga sp. Cy-1792]|uniref:outer membrane protein assembly factor BamB family protein n=1 Tax=Chitinophaga sp. Cy-1792 TaxID=2608339 RepID=UPI001420C2A7|nr:PQQ-binding-like beta-propeller repeat protein [Chitinophaga sp. Cy-1792]NIG55545.1 PQQ-binding-like beta-propeller repeat protein [Chitinophaga sp. Cy-1792]
MKRSILFLFLCLSVVISKAQYRQFGDVSWTFSIPGQFFTTPAVFKNSVIIGGMDGKLYSLDKNNGKKQWQFQAGAGIGTHLLADDKQVYFGSYDGHYYAVDAGTGKQRWSFATKGEKHIGGKGYWTMQPLSQEMEDQYDLYLSSPATDGKLVFFGSSDSSIYAVDKTNGKLVWQHKTAGPVHAGLTYYNGQVFAGSWDRNIYALNSQTGKVNWSFASKVDTIYHGVLQGIQATPLVYNNTLYIGTRDANLYALDVSDGKLKWSYRESDAWIVGPAVQANNRIYVGTSDSYQMLCINAADGKEIFKHKSGGYVFGAPALSKDILCYGDFTGRLFLLNNITGKVLDQFDTKGRKANAASVLDSSGNISFMHIANGQDPSFYSTAKYVMKELYKLESFTAAPVVADDKVFVAGGGSLYAIGLKK